MIENVTIVGMGALGILYGDLMERTLGPGHVRFIAEGERLTRLQQEGAWCNGRKCDFTVTDNTGEEAELLLFAVKMTALDEGHAGWRPRRLGRTR
ncbi:MAG: 2-dehydropantoate 2-reductase N-terminal domain-containing protein [Evtepia sp.]